MRFFNEAFVKCNRKSNPVAQFQQNWVYAGLVGEALNISVEASFHHQYIVRALNGNAI